MAVLETKDLGPSLKSRYKGENPGLGSLSFKKSKYYTPKP